MVKGKYTSIRMLSSRGALGRSCSSRRTRGTSTPMLTCPPGSISAYATHGAAPGRTPANCTTNRALPSNSNSGCSEPRYSRQCLPAASRGTHEQRATTTRCAEPITVSWLAASVGERTIAPTTPFPIWTRLSRREVKASRRLYAWGVSCSRGLWRVWRIRDCRSAWCSENWWGARAA